MLKKSYKFIIISLLAITVIYLVSHFLTKDESEVREWIVNNNGSFRIDYPGWVKESPSFIRPLCEKITGHYVIEVTFFESEINNINKLEDLSYLECLSLGSTNVKDISILHSLKSLKLIVLFQNDISDTDVLSLRESLPNCVIDFFQD